MLIVSSPNSMNSLCFVSEGKPRISLAIPVYHALHDALQDAAERKGEFEGPDNDVAIAVRRGVQQ